RHGVAAWLALGAVVLAITGGEALYADMGHFGRGPIRIGWLTLVLPSLLLNYFGQGALILAHPDAVQNPFYLMVPQVLLYPMVILATLAAVIATQALISGTFSVVREAIQLGYLPRMKVIHTSSQTRGQIYLPAVNRALLVAVMAVVIGYGSSSALAAGYGVSVTRTMLISGILILTLAHIRWRVSAWILWPMGVVFIGIDLAFVSSNLVKFLEGAWFPLALGLAAFTLMRTWRRGRSLVQDQVSRDSLRIEHFVDSLLIDPPHRVGGTAIFLTSANDYLPPALLHNLKHNQVLHAHNLLLSIKMLDVPRAGEADRVSELDLGAGFIRLTLRFGYMEDPDVPQALRAWATTNFTLDPMVTTYFASRESLVSGKQKGMAPWRDKLFLLLSRNSTPATEYFSVPADRLVELGTKLVI
ncbi:MAG: KUP/HAK/KT family potassium transporter, partial [Frankiaceae bacterium]|nr:KUP/HAK/KT family potassium transporter [Arenimonas sp.]